jgi:hypothetical protein
MVSGAPAPGVTFRSEASAKAAIMMTGSSHGQTFVRLVRGAVTVDGDMEW